MADQAQYVGTRVAVLNTSDNVQTTAFTYDVPMGTCIYAKAVVLARSTSGDTVYAEEINAAVNNSVGPAVMGGVKSIWAALSTALGVILGTGAPTSTIDVSGSQIRVRVTGKAGTPLQWQIHVRFFVN